MAARSESMPTGPLNPVVQRLMADFGSDGSGMTDGELLTCFLSSRDDNVLAALVRRHASMVWSVCRRLLNHHDAEDAFQATFLVLVHKAANVPGHAVANWLYGVARQTAVRLRATVAKRGQRETQAVDVPEPTARDVRDADLQATLDEELSRLPDHYRSVIILCDLEEMTRREAARQLGIPEGSVASRLARARAMLAKRLTRRGVVFTSVSAAVSPGAALPVLVASTIKTATLLTAGEAATPGAISATVSDLTKGMVNAMFVAKIKSVLAVVLVAGLALGGIGTGVGLLTKPVAVARTEPPKQPPVKEESPTPPVVTKKDEGPPHVVEKTDKKAGVDTFRSLRFPVTGEPTEDALLEASKLFMSRIPPSTHGDVRFRDFFDPRYLKKHGLTDREIAFEFADHRGINNILVADDLRTVLCITDLKGRGKEAIILRYAVYEGHIYISPEKAPDPKTGVFKPWILRKKLFERKPSPPPAPSDKQPEKPPHVVEKLDKKQEEYSGLPWKVGPEPTAEAIEETLRVTNKHFFSSMSSPQNSRFREYFDPRYLKKHGLTDRDIAFECANSLAINNLDVADDNRTVLVTLEDGRGVKEAFLTRWVVHEGHIYISPEKAPDSKTGIFKPWILRTKVN